METFWPWSANRQEQHQLEKMMAYVDGCGGFKVIVDA